MLNFSNCACGFDVTKFGTHRYRCWLEPIACIDIVVGWNAKFVRFCSKGVLSDCGAKPKIENTIHIALF
jgi:hypothetical protein